MLDHLEHETAKTANTCSDSDASNARAMHVRSPLNCDGQVIDLGEVPCLPVSLKTSMERVADFDGDGDLEIAEFLWVIRGEPVLADFAECGLHFDQRSARCRCVVLFGGCAGASFEETNALCPGECVRRLASKKQEKEGSLTIEKRYPYLSTIHKAKRRQLLAMVEGGGLAGPLSLTLRPLASLPGWPESVAILLVLLLLLSAVFIWLSRRKKQAMKVNESRQRPSADGAPMPFLPVNLTRVTPYVCFCCALGTGLGFLLAGHECHVLLGYIISFNSFSYGVMRASFLLFPKVEMSERELSSASLKFLCFTSSVVMLFFAWTILIHGFDEDHLGICPSSMDLADISVAAHRFIPFNYGIQFLAGCILGLESSYMSANSYRAFRSLSLMIQSVFLSVLYAGTAPHVSSTYVWLVVLSSATTFWVGHGACCFCFSQSATNAHDQEDAANPCSICLDTPCSHALVPCGHLCLCGDCSNQLLQLPARRQLCPICQGAFVRTLRVWNV